MTSTKQLRLRHEKRIKNLEKECVDAIVILEKNAKEIRVFRGQLSKFAAAISLLSVERVRLRLLDI